MGKLRFRSFYFVLVIVKVSRFFGGVKGFLFWGEVRGYRRFGFRLDRIVEIRACFYRG